MAWHGMTRTAGQCTRGNTSTPQGHFRQAPPHKSPPVHTLALPSPLPACLPQPPFLSREQSRAGGEAATATASQPARAAASTPTETRHASTTSSESPTPRRESTLRLAVAAAPSFARVLYYFLFSVQLVARFFFLARKGSPRSGSSLVGNQSEELKT